MLTLLAVALFGTTAFADNITQQALIDPKTQPTNEWASVVWAVDDTGWKINYPAPDTVSIELDSGEAKPRGKEKRVSYLLKYLPVPAMKPWKDGSLHFDFDAAVTSYQSTGAAAVAHLTVMFSIRATGTKDRFWFSVGLFDPRIQRRADDRAGCVPSRSTPSPVVATRAEHGRSFIELSNQSAEFSHLPSQDYKRYRLSVTRENIVAAIKYLRTLTGWCARHENISTNPDNYEVRQVAVMLEARTDRNKAPDASAKIAISLRDPNIWLGR
jgi:hypothetical protein